MRAIDKKHHVENDQIIKTTNGQPIPVDEPLFLFRARDWLAIPTLLKYREFCVKDGCNEWQLSQIDEVIERFRVYAVVHSDKMKQPGITRGL